MNSTNKEHGERIRKHILALIKWHWETHYCTPTIRDLQTILEYKSTSTVVHHLEIMKKEGVLRETERGLVPTSMHIDFGGNTALVDWYGNTITSGCGGPEYE